MNGPAASPALAVRQAPKPRLGFLGLGWIGRARLAALAETGSAEIRALADADRSALDEAGRVAPEAARVHSLDELLQCPIDGIVIATPSALHAEQALSALRRGIPVFCQKPLARTGAEAGRLVAEARRQDLPLGVDYCYRRLAGMAQLRAAIQGGELGQVFAAELVFHNAYGPDKPWFRDLQLAGGGCLTDLGTHLLDLAFWCLGNPAVERLESRLYAGGRRLQAPLTQVEDYAALDIDLAGGTHLSVRCSWNLHAGRDAVIGARFYGAEGALTLANVDGSYYDFRIERLSGTSGRLLAGHPDAWGGRALCAWVDQVAAGHGFDAEEDLTLVPRLIDLAYGRPGQDLRP